MSDSSFQQLIDQVFPPDDAQMQQQLAPLYHELEEALKDSRPGRKGEEEVSLRFERLRLGVGIALMQLLTDLGGDEDSALVRDLLEDALRATSPQEIDRVIQQKSHLFDDLYTDLYVNVDAEQVLALFESTLSASSLAEADEVIAKALVLAQDLEFQQDEEEDTPDA